jgi:hypothetical protein
MANTGDPLARFKDFEVSEPCELVRTVEVVKGECQYRLEVMKSLQRNNFFVHCYRLVETTTLEVTSGCWSRLSPEEAPPNDENDGYKALETALSFLRKTHL